MFAEPSVGDVERNYRSTLSKTPLRSDRGDLGLYSFAGSNLHGGKPAADRGSMPKPTRSTNQDLYAPLNAAEYGKGYYDHLRATSPDRRTRTRASDLDDLPSSRRFTDTEYKTLPTKISTEFDYGNDRQKATTTKKTTITEQWVPLTTYIYNTPNHSYHYRSTPHSSYTYRTADDLYSYNYVDDYKRYGNTTTTTRTKNIDALDLSVSSKTKEDYSHYMDKCRNIQSQLNEVSKTYYEAEMKLKTEVVNARNHLQADLTEVSLVVDDAARYNEDLYRAIQKQAKQISALNSKYDDVNRHIVDVSETLEKSRMRCLSLQSDLTSVQSALELSMKRRF